MGGFFGNTAASGGSPADLTGGGGGGGLGVSDITAPQDVVGTLFDPMFGSAMMGGTEGGVGASAAASPYYGGQQPGAGGTSPQETTQQQTQTDPTSSRPSPQGQTGQPSLGSELQKLAKLLSGGQQQRGTGWTQPQQQPFQLPQRPPGAPPTQPYEQPPQQPQTPGAQGTPQRPQPPQPQPQTAPQEPPSQGRPEPRGPGTYPIEAAMTAAPAAGPGGGGATSPDAALRAPPLTALGRPGGLLQLLSNLLGVADQVAPNYARIQTGPSPLQRALSFDRRPQRFASLEQETPDSQPPSPAPGTFIPSRIFEPLSQPGAQKYDRYYDQPLAPTDVIRSNYQIGTPTQPNVDRSQFQSELQSNVSTHRRFGSLKEQAAQMVIGEVGFNDVRTARIQLETAFNRAQMNNKSLGHALMETTRGGYYPPTTYRGRPSAKQMQFFEENIWNPVIKGSNYSDTGQGPMTGNASNEPGNHLANRQMRRMPGYGMPNGEYYFRERVPRGYVFPQQGAPDQQAIMLPKGTTAPMTESEPRGMGGGAGFGGGIHPPRTPPQPSSVPIQRVGRNDLLDWLSEQTA